MAEAKVAKLRFERKLKAASTGLEVPQNPGEATICIIARLPRFLHLHPPREDKTERVEISGQVYSAARSQHPGVCSSHRQTIHRALHHRRHILSYKEHLYSWGRAHDTVLNKLSCIVTWLKRNGLVSTVVLPADERPEPRETEGPSFSETGVDKMMELATRHTFERGDEYHTATLPCAFSAHQGAEVTDY